MNRFTREGVERVTARRRRGGCRGDLGLHRPAPLGEPVHGAVPVSRRALPSFSVDQLEKLYHCFGCGVGGDVIKFVEEKEGLSFPEAVEALAERYGVELTREAEDPRAEELRR